MNEPTPSQLERASAELSDLGDLISPRQLADKRGDETTGPVIADIRAGVLAALEKRSGPRVRYSIYKKDAIPWLAAQMRLPTEKEEK